MSKKEIKKRGPHAPRHTYQVRSILDLGDFNDNELNLEPSMTDETQDVPIQEIVNKLCRGEAVAGVEPVYDHIPEGATDAQVFAAQSPVERSGFDLADVPAILDAGVAAAAALKSGGTDVPPAPEKQPEGAPPAEKSGAEAPKPAETPV